MKKNVDKQWECDTVDIISGNVESDVQRLVAIKKSHPSNPLTCYLNINNARNKIVKLHKVFFHIASRYSLYRWKKNWPFLPKFSIPHRWLINCPLKTEIKTEEGK